MTTENYLRRQVVFAGSNLATRLRSEIKNLESAEKLRNEISELIDAKIRLALHEYHVVKFSEQD